MIMSGFKMSPIGLTIMSKEILTYCETGIVVLKAGWLAS